MSEQTVTETPAPATNAIPAPKDSSFLPVSATVSKVEKVNGVNKYVEVSKGYLFTPTLSSFGITAEAQKDEKTGEVLKDDDGIVIYQDGKYNFLQNAVLAAVKVIYRNLHDKEGKLKEGAVVPSTFEELLDRGTVGNGAALAIVRDAKKAFAAYMASTGKSINSQGLAVSLFGNKVALATQPDKIKESMKGYVGGFMEGLSAEDLEKYSKYMMSVADACDTKTDIDDF